MSTNINYTEPQIVTSNDLNKRAYIVFYLNGKRIRIGNGETLRLRISPNRAKTIDDRNRQLNKLQYELKKALEANCYPVADQSVSPTTNQMVSFNIKRNTALGMLFIAVRGKLRSNLSKKYKRNLKVIYRQFKQFMSTHELTLPLNEIPLLRIEAFLNQFTSTGTYYMNKRRDLGVLFNSAGGTLDQPISTIKRTAKRKAKARLHKPYEKEQLRPILSYLQMHYPKLYVCCLLTYSTWLRPHEEIRLLTLQNFKKDCTEIHLSGDENKGGKVRVVYVPEYTRDALASMLAKLSRNQNIFSSSNTPMNESYFTTTWSRAFKKMYALGLIYDNQTIYSFRHTAAVDTYRRTKDVYLLQKLLGHSSILVTLKYLRSLGEFNSEELRDAAPQL
jgi:integrase